jgi:hypothetical protein
MTNRPRVLVTSYDDAIAGTITRALGIVPDVVEPRNHLWGSPRITTWSCS